jgi:hypothetical protein
MTRNETREATRAEAVAPLSPAMAARMLANLHRAASPRSQDHIEQAIGRLGLWGRIVNINGALVAVEG